MDLRRLRALYEAGMSISAIAREAGQNWRTVKKYVEAPPPVVRRNARLARAAARRPSSCSNRSSTPGCGLTSR
jgi:transposase